MHPRTRKIAIVLLSLGTIVGFGSGFASMRHRACARRDAFEKRVADICVDAARRQGEGEGLAADDSDRDRRGRDRDDHDHDGPRRGGRHGSDSHR
jgi:hypothetical protein